MKRALSAFISLAFMSSAALARDCGAMGSQSLAAYAGLGSAGCTVTTTGLGTVVDFSNFQLLTPSLTGSALNFDLTASSGADYAGFQLSPTGTWTAPVSVVLSYNVKVLSGSLDQALFEVSGTASGNSGVSLTEDLLQAAGITPVGGGPIVAGGTVTSLNTLQTVTFSPSLSSFTVRDTLMFSGPGSITGVSNGFTAPEPANFALAGLALAGLGILKRKQSRR